MIRKGAAVRRRMHYFSFEISNAPDWCEDVRRCRTGLNPHFLFVLPKRLPGFPAELYRFGTEKPGGYSLLKRECPPRPPKEKRGGISISPRTPLKRHKGAGCGPPLWKPLPETRDGAGKTNPQGDEGRETRIKQKTDRVVHSEAERTRAEIRRFGFVPRYAPYLPAGAGICRFDIRV